MYTCDTFCVYLLSRVVSLANMDELIEIRGVHGDGDGRFPMGMGMNVVGIPRG